MHWAILLLCAAAAAQAAPSWHVVNGSLGTDITGIGFVSGTEGFVVGGANGVGAEILKSVDGGQTWNSCQADFGADILLLDMDAVGTTVVVSSVFGELYSIDDGASFLQSRGGGQSQSVRFIGVNGDGGKVFGCAGTYKFGKVQGCAISKDGGKTFTAYDAKLFTLARYGAYPTDNTWYISAGAWPSSERGNEPQRKTFFHDKNGKLKGFERRSPLGDAGWEAQISKTTDGGATWKTVFANNGTFYLNGIDCADENNCCAVGESSGVASGGGGARIYCTTDGGASWNLTFFMAETQKQQFSLIEIRYVSSTTVWAVGGELTAVSPSAWFLVSVDGGKTWNQSGKPILGFYAFGLSMVNANLGYAAVDNLITQSAGVAKFS